jgi:UDP-2,4-diacetamido-2,4,6-trideoxy-beta-L-altropyranose hydrolase
MRVPRREQGAAVDEKARILFLADAGAKVGGGHVMRCLTLAEALIRRGAACAFLAPPAVVAILDAFARAPIEVIPLAGEPSAAEFAAAGAKLSAGDDAIVADHYGFGPEEDALLARTGARLLILDDLRRRHEHGMVLDSGIGRAAADYPGRELLAGPAYALVREEFARARPMTLKRRALGAPVGRVMVALGLADAGAITSRVVRALLPRLEGMALDIVLGDGAPSRAEMEQLAAADARIAVHVDTRAMARLTAAADVAVGAGGSSVWERCVLGLPSLTLMLADNQRANAEALANAGATFPISPPSGDFETRLGSAFDALVADAAVRAAMTEAAAALCDGQGAERVAERLLAG